MRKKLAILGMAGILSIMSCMPVYASTVDDEFPLKTIGFSFSQAADTRYMPKDDYTSHYVHNESGFNLWIRSLTSNNVNHTVGLNAIVPTGEYFVRNNVKENGYSSCRLNVSTATSGTTGRLKGRWSADSVGNYPVAN